MIHRFKGLEIDTTARSIRCKGANPYQGRRSFTLLEFLIKNSKRVATKEEIVAAVWDGVAVSDVTLATAVHDLCQIIEKAGGEYSMVRNHYNRRIQFIAPDENEDLLDFDKTISNQSGATNPIVAVMPFVGLSSGPELVYLGDGMAGDIRNGLSRLSDINVMSGMSSCSIYGRSFTTKELLTKFGIDYLLEGSVRRVGSCLRVTAQFADTQREAQIWAGSDDLPDHPCFEDQVGVVSKIVNSTAAALRSHERKRILSTPVHELTAYDYHLQVSALLNSSQPDAIEDAIQLFEHGMPLDPNSAGLHAMHSYALILKDKCGIYEHTTSAFPNRRTAHRVEALKMARKSVELDPSVTIAWLSLARCYISLGDYKNASAAAERALDLNGELGLAHGILGYCHWPLNRCDEAIQHFDKALDAGSLAGYGGVFMSGKSCALAVLGRYDEAIEWSHRAQFEPYADHFTFCGEICALGHLGRRKEAQVVVELAQKSSIEINLQNLEYELHLPDPEIRKRFLGGLTLAGLT